jgi:hypothetical protein
MVVPSSVVTCLPSISRLTFFISIQIKYQKSNIKIVELPLCGNDSLILHFLF